MIIVKKGSLAEQMIIQPSLKQAILKELYGDDYNDGGNHVNHFSIDNYHNYSRKFRNTNMKKLSIREWLELHYGKKSISIKTIRRRCKNGEIQNAIKEGKKWFIVEEEKSHEKR